MIFYPGFLGGDPSDQEWDARCQGILFLVLWSLWFPLPFARRLLQGFVVSKNFHPTKSQVQSGRVWAWMLLSAGSWLEFDQSLNILPHPFGMVYLTGAFFSNYWVPGHPISFWFGISVFNAILSINSSSQSCCIQPYCFSGSKLERCLCCSPLPAGSLSPSPLDSSTHLLSGILFSSERYPFSSEKYPFSSERYPFFFLKVLYLW